MRFYFFAKRTIGKAVKKSSTTKYIHHLRKPFQFAGKTLAQLCRIFTPLAKIKKTASAVHCNIQPAIGIEVHRKSTKGRVCQRQNLRYATRRQDMKGCLHIITTQIEALVKGLTRYRNLKSNFRVWYAWRRSNQRIYNSI